MTETTESGDKRTGPSGGHHVGELKLRRLLAGESLGEEHAAVATHTAGCAECSRRIDGLVAEQRAFEGRISFDRFAAGVETCGPRSRQSSRAPLVGATGQHAIVLDRDERGGAGGGVSRWCSGRDPCSKAHGFVRRRASLPARTGSRGLRAPR